MAAAFVCKFVVERKKDFSGSFWWIGFI